MNFNKIGRVMILSVLLLSLTESIQSQDPDGTDIRRGSPLLTLLRVKRFDFHMFGCECRPVMECSKDNDCKDGFICGYRCCAFKCIKDAARDEIENVVDNDNVTVDVVENNDVLVGSGDSDDIIDDIDATTSESLTDSGNNADTETDYGVVNDTNVFDTDKDNNYTIDSDLDFNETNNNNTYNGEIPIDIPIKIQDNNNDSTNLVSINNKDILDTGGGDGVKVLENPIDHNINTDTDDRNTNTNVGNHDSERNPQDNTKHNGHRNNNKTNNNT